MSRPWLAAVVTPFLLAGCERLDPPPSGQARAKAEADVAEAVFRHMLQEMKKRPGWAEHTSAICLEIRRKDPAPDFLERFAGVAPPIRAASSCTWTQPLSTHVIDRHTNKPATILEASGFRWHTGRHVTVTCGYAEASLSGGGYTYDLTRWGQSWRVRSSRLEFIA